MQEKMKDWCLRQRELFLRERQAVFAKPAYGPTASLSLTEMMTPNKEMEAVLLRMDAYFAENPKLPACLLKARLHEIMAEECAPVVFPDNPFYFETGMGRSPYGSLRQYGPGPGNWMIGKRFNQTFWNGSDLSCSLDQVVDLGLFLMVSPGSRYHLAFNSTRILEEGFEGVMAEIAGEKPNCSSQHERDFLDAAERSVNAVLLIADKFASEARRLLETQNNPHWQMIADSAGHAPRKPARTFYEGLAVLKFLHELPSVMEGALISVVGHPDRQLAKLYGQDLAAGRLTKDKAAELITLWLDVFAAQADNADSETDSTVMLGGCDEDGRPVFNDITRMMFETYCERKLLHPKLNCRFGSSSPDAWLVLLATQIQRGFNAFVLLNDDALIAANIKVGKRPEDARRYVAGGCWEVSAEGCEICTVGLNYLNLPVILSLCLGTSPDNGFIDGLQPGNEALLNAVSFDEFHELFMRKLEAIIGKWAKLRQEWASALPEVNPTPFLSASLWDCVKKHKDQTEGGCRYNPESISVVGLATLADSLTAIKRLCFERKTLSLRELAAALKNNWEGCGELQRLALSAPKFGAGDDYADTIAAGLHAHLCQLAERLENYRGGHHLIDYFGAYNHVVLGGRTPATPDGRKAGEHLSQSITPGRLRRTGSLTDVIASMRKMDFSKCSGNASLDLSLPVGCKMPTGTLVAFIRGAAAAGVPSLQLNSVSLEDLKDAQANPGRHEDLVIRLYGLSARFVSLSKSWQEEFIQRGISG